MVVVRTCIGCRERAAATDLVRFVLAEGGIVIPDPDGTLPGRGAHLHPTSRCLELAGRRRAFSRAFRTKGAIELAWVERWAEQTDDRPQVRATALPDENGAPAHEHSMSTFQ